MAIFIATASPSSPTCVMVGPIARTYGRTFSSAAGSPPTMNESWPASTVTALPDTGASIRAAPRAAAACAQLARDGGADRAHLDPYGAGPKPGDDAVGAEADRAERGVVGDHAEDRVRGLGHPARRLREREPGGDERRAPSRASGCSRRRFGRSRAAAWPCGCPSRRARRSRGWPSAARYLVGHGDRADLELAPGMRGQARHLDRRRRRQVTAEIRGPHAVEVVLLRDVGEEARRRDQIGEGAAGRLEGLLEILHHQHGLLAHRRRADRTPPRGAGGCDRPAAAVTPERNTSCPRRTTIPGAYGITTSVRRSAWWTIEMSLAIASSARRSRILPRGGDASRVGYTRIRGDDHRSRRRRLDA